MSMPVIDGEGDFSRFSCLCWDIYHFSCSNRLFFTMFR